MCQRMWCTCEVVVVLLVAAATLNRKDSVDMIDINCQNWPITGCIPEWCTENNSYRLQLPRSFRATSLDALLPHYLGAWNRLCRFQIPGTAFRISCQSKLDCGFQSLTGFLIECFHMASRRPYWCSKAINRRPCWCPKPILWELNSFLMHTPSFVLINLHRC